MSLQSSYEHTAGGNFRFFSVFRKRGGNGQKNFSVKNGRELFFKSEPHEQNKICWEKIGSLGTELRAGKVRTNIAEQLASNPRRDSYELCRLVALPPMIRFCSNISHFFRQALT